MRSTLCAVLLFAAHALAAAPPVERAVHWSLRPLALSIPQAQRAWVRNPIDAFVLARLHHAGLRPAPDLDELGEAGRRTLIRRVTFDLIGLPPTGDIETGEVEAFVRDSSSDAYERLVDRLLASPRYGERWGRHWLDVV